MCNIGNPQAFGSPPLTYNRQILAGLMYPDLIKKGTFHEDVNKRVEFYLKNLGNSNVGAYTESHGYSFVR